jgi:hypothetical protein
VGSRASVIDCFAQDNGADGFLTSAGTRVLRCNAYSNGGVGIHCPIGNDGSQIRSCIASGNVGGGIRVGDDSLVQGCHARFNLDYGIQVSRDSLIVDNYCNNNSGKGIHVTSEGNRIEGNHLHDDEIDVDGAPNLIVRNSVESGGTFAFTVVAGNAVGPILGIADVATNDSPHANFEF